jgi:hypothetical protein
MHQRALVWLFETWGLEWKDLCDRAARSLAPKFYAVKFLSLLVF